MTLALVYLHLGWSLRAIRQSPAYLHICPPNCPPITLLLLLFSWSTDTCMQRLLSSCSRFCERYRASNQETNVSKLVQTPCKLSQWEEEASQLQLPCLLLLWPWIRLAALCTWRHALHSQGVNALQWVRSGSLKLLCISPDNATETLMDRPRTNLVRDGCTPPIQWTYPLHQRRGQAPWWTDPEVH